jgi:HSP20 family molecular chaperone IbpA
MMKAFRNLLTSVDFLNTVHGGVSEPFVSFRENENGREIQVRVPGVEKESLQVEINNNVLLVYYILPISGTGRVVPMQKSVLEVAIPASVELEGIKATYGEKDLLILLPYNRLARGYNKKLKIGE